jgi:hypothetical protein
MSEWLEFFNAYRAPAQHIASLLLAAAIWRWGGSPERWIIAIFIATMVMPLYVMRWLDLGYLGDGSNTWIYLLLDLVAGALFVAVALNANRNYPLLIAGFQLVAVGAHIVSALVESASPLAIAILVIGPSYCQLAVLFAGFLRHTARQRRFGGYREWRVPARSVAGLRR